MKRERGGEADVITATVGVIVFAAVAACIASVKHVVAIVAVGGVGVVL